MTREREEARLKAELENAARVAAARLAEKEARQRKKYEREAAVAAKAVEARKAERQMLEQARAEREAQLHAAKAARATRAAQKELEEALAKGGAAAAAAAALGGVEGERQRSEFRLDPVAVYVMPSAERDWGAYERPCPAPHAESPAQRIEQLRRQDARADGDPARLRILRQPRDTQGELRTPAPVRGGAARREGGDAGGSVCDGRVGGDVYADIYSVREQATRTRLDTLIARADDMLARPLKYADRFGVVPRREIDPFSGYPTPPPAAPTPPVARRILEESSSPRVARLEMKSARAAVGGVAGATAPPPPSEPRCGAATVRN